MNQKKITFYICLIYNVKLRSTEKSCGFNKILNAKIFFKKICTQYMKRKYWLCPCGSY